MSTPAPTESAPELEPQLPDARLLVLAKAPMAGRSKTRLMPAFSAVEAAELAEAALRDTLVTVAQTVLAARRAGLAVEPVLVLDGKAGDWSPPSLRVVPQVPGSLDVRLDAAFADAAPVPCLLLGMDTPQAPTALLVKTLLDLCDPGSDVDAHLAPAADGGWWALGLRQPRAGLLEGLPMSTSSTCAATQQRLRQAGLRLGTLPLLTDVDTAGDAALVAAQAPWTAFADRYRHLRKRSA